MQLRQNEFDFIRDLVLERSGIVLDAGKMMFIHQRLGLLIKETGHECERDLAKAVMDNPNGNLATKLVEGITTYETSFFRDRVAFQALKNVVLPELIQKRANEATLNIWSNGCSSGQEPYSLLMMLRDSFPQLKSWTIRLLSTDISHHILDRARGGIYNQLEVNRGLPAPMLLKYFHKQALEWQMKPEFRSVVEFRELNLVKPWPPLPKMDIIMLRNVLVYFKSDTKREILTKISGTMRPDGYLFMGTAEIPMTQDNLFKKIDVERSGGYVLRS